MTNRLSEVRKQTATTANLTDRGDGERRAAREDAGWQGHSGLCGLCGRLQRLSAPALFWASVIHHKLLAETAQIPPLPR